MIIFIACTGRDPEVSQNILHRDFKKGSCETLRDLYVYSFSPAYPKKRSLGISKDPYEVPWYFFEGFRQQAGFFLNHLQT